MERALEGATPQESEFFENFDEKQCTFAFDGGEERVQLKWKRNRPNPKQFETNKTEIISQTIAFLNEFFPADGIEGKFAMLDLESLPSPTDKQAMKALAALTAPYSIPSKSSVKRNSATFNIEYDSILPGDSQRKIGSEYWSAYPKLIEMAGQLGKKKKNGDSITQVLFEVGFSVHVLEQSKPKM